MTERRQNALPITNEEFFGVAVRVMNLRGYLVIGFPDWTASLEVGDTTHNFAQFPSPAPLKLIRETTSKDWIEQLKLFHELSPTKPLLEAPEPGRFFRVVTD